MSRDVDGEPSRFRTTLVIRERGRIHDTPSAGVTRRHGAKRGAPSSGSNSPELTYLSARARISLAGNSSEVSIVKSSINPVVAIVVIVIVLAVIVAVGWKSMSGKKGNVGKDPSNAMKGMKDANPDGMTPAQPDGSETGAEGSNSTL